MESLFQTTKSYIPYVEQQAPKDDVQAAKLMGTGYAISLGEDSDHQYILSMFHNSKKAINYKKAASYLKKNLLLTDSSQQLLQVLATAHKSITKSLHCETGERIIGGSYRTTDIAVYPNEPSEHKKAKNFFDDFQIKKLGGKAPREADVEITNSDLIMLAKQGIYLAPLPKKISGLMEQFAKDFLFGLQQVKENKITPIAFAAWAHLEIVHIHPFEDGNGRLARLVANTILMAYDYPPMIIGSNEDYTAALNAYTETNDPAYFSRYMVETIAWTAKQLNKPQTGLLEDFETQEEL